MLNGYFLLSKSKILYKLIYILNIIDIVLIIILSCPKEKLGPPKKIKLLNCSKKSSISEDGV